MANVATGLACILVGCGGLFRDDDVMTMMMGNDEKHAKSDDDDAASQSWGLTLQLLGVSFISLSCSLGEVSGHSFVHVGKVLFPSKSWP